MPEGRLQDLLGDVSLVGTEVLAKTKYPQPALGDIKNALIEYIVLPLGASRLTEHCFVIALVCCVSLITLGFVIVINIPTMYDAFLFIVYKCIICH